MKNVGMDIKATKNNDNKNILKNIFREVRLLRNEVSLLMPVESIKEYAHPSRIKNSFKKALRQYPA